MSSFGIIYILHSYTHQKINFQMHKIINILTCQISHGYCLRFQPKTKGRKGGERERTAIYNKNHLSDTPLATVLPPSPCMPSGPPVCCRGCRTASSQSMLHSLKFFFKNHHIIFGFCQIFQLIIMHVQCRFLHLGCRVR